MNHGTLQTDDGYKMTANTNKGLTQQSAIAGKPKWDNPIINIRCLKDKFIYFGHGMRENCDIFQVITR